MSDVEGGDLRSVVKVGAEVVAEIAKAEQEQQKTIQSGLDLVRRAGSFLGGVFGPASQELSLMFGDQMRYWRFKNAANILEKAQAITDKRGLKPELVKALRFGEGLLLLDAASLEEEETVQNLWARLMANAVDPEKATKPEKVYLDILKSLSSREVLFLELLARIDEGSVKYRSQREYEAFVEVMNTYAEAHWRRFSAEERAISIQNLVRLRCVTFRASPIDLGNLFGTVPIEGQHGVSLGRKWAVVDPEKFQRILKEMVERQHAASGMMDFPTGGTSTMYRTALRRQVSLPEANFMLTPLGRGLLDACDDRVQKAP